MTTGLFRKFLARCALVAAALFLGTNNVRAQEATQQSGLTFYFTPYLWVSSLTGTVATSNPNIPSQTATASFGDLFSHLNKIPIIGAGEVRYGRFGLLTDLMVMSLKTDIERSGPAFSGGSSTVTQLVATILPMYRVMELPEQTLDLGIGARVIAMWTNFSVNAGLLPGFSTSPSVSWAAPIAGLRYHYDLPSDFGVTIAGDVGGLGGNSNLTWQALGTVDYRYRAWLVFHLGYRHMHIDYDAGRLNTSTALSGPLIGATMRF
jgi:hypothetical protein